MIVKLTRDEARDLWRLRNGFAPLRDDCLITVSDGLDSDALIDSELDRWYSDLLANAPLDLLEISEIAPKTTLTICPDGSGIVSLPADCCRVVSLSLGNWRFPAKLIKPGENLRLEALQASPYVRGGSHHPVAIVEPRQIRIFSPDPANPHLTSLRCVMRPQDDEFHFDMAALPKIS